MFELTPTFKMASMSEIVSKTEISTSEIASKAVPTGSTKSKSRSKLCVIDAPISISISIFSAYANETSHIDDYQQGEHFFRSRFRSR